MGFFGKKNTEEEKSTPRNPNNVVTFRLLAVAYVAYLCYQMVSLYLEGGPDAPTLPVLIIGVVLLGGGAIVMAILSYKEYQRNKVKYEAAMAELRAEAEAKRAAEEAKAAEEAEEDAYYDALEAEADDEDEE